MAGEQGKTGEGQGQGGESLETLKSQLEGMKGEFEQLKGAKADLEKKLDDADKELLSPEYLEFLEGKRGKGAPSKEVEKEVNFDEMTPAQIAQHFERKYKGDLKTAAEEVGKRMDIIEDGIGKLAAQFDLTLTSMKHPELGTAFETSISERSAEQKALIDGMYKLAQENPAWSAEKCYRAAKLEMKASADEKSEKEKERAEKERKALTEKGGVPPSVLQGKEVGKEEAAQSAWKAAFGSKTTLE